MTDSSSGQRPVNELPILLLFAVAGLSIAAAQLTAWQYLVGWDSVSYLEIADQVLKGHFQELFGSYWSPLFPLLLALIKVVTSNSLDEFMVLALAMYGAFAFSFAAFAYFAHGLLCLHTRLQEQEGDRVVTVSPNQLLVVMYASYLYCTLGISELSHKTPDVLASGVCFLALAQWLSMVNGKDSVGRSALTGFLVGLSYWAKNFNIGWGPVFIVCMIIFERKNGLKGKRLMAMLSCYVITMAALAVPISLKAGHPTLSDVVRVGGAWSETVGYMGIVHGRGAEFSHPTRIFFTDPIFYEFATPYSDVTYPPFYAPQYWYDGVKLHVDWPSYFHKLWDKALLYGNLLGYCLLLVLLLFCIGSKSPPLLKERLIVLAPGLIPSIIGMAVIYFMLDPEGRYYASSLAPLLCYLCASIGLPPGTGSRRKLKIGLGALTIWMLLFLAFRSWFHLYFAWPDYAQWLTQSTKLPFPPSPVFSQHRANIEALQQAGLKPGDRIARVTRCGDGEFYWAKGAHLRIVCETPDVDGFWKSTKENRQALYQKLKDFGVKAIVQDWSPPSKSEYPVPSDPGWSQVPNTKTYIYLLR